MNCIFCNDEINEKNFSREHIIPESLGGKFVIDNVCKECNSRIGADFEDKLNKNTIITFILSYYLIKNKSYKYVTPHIKPFGDKKTIFKMTDDGQIYMHTLTNVVENGKNTIIEFDKTESQKYIEGTVNKKINRLNKKQGSNIPNYCEDSKQNFKETEKLEYGDYVPFKMEMDLSILVKLFIKISYEFAYIYLDSDYSNDNVSIMLKKIISLTDEDFNKYLSSDQSMIQVEYDTERIEECIGKVIKTSQLNTENIHYKKELKPSSNGDYIHKVSMFNEKGKIFVNINLFDIFLGRICVSEDANKYVDKSGKLMELITGRKNNKVINKLIRN